MSNQHTLVLAVRRLEGDPQERAQTLAQVTGLGLFEARARVRPPGPRVVATRGDPTEAFELLSALQRAGFEPLLLGPHELGQNLEEVRSFELSAEGLVAETREGEVHRIRGQEIRLLLRGTGIVRKTEVETKQVRKLSLSRAAMTGGLVFTKTKKVTKSKVREDAQGFLHLYAAGHPPLVMRETSLVYTGLGKELRASRAANFNLLAVLLRKLAPAARFDEQLKRRAGQVHLLGSGALSPDTHLHVAIALLAASYGA